MFEYLDRFIRPLALTMREMSGYLKTFKVEDKNNKLTLFGIDDEKLLKKYKAIQTEGRRLKKYFKKHFFSL